MGYLYEKDLRMMKYHILQSPRHMSLVSRLADDLGMRVPDLQKAMIRRCDMAYLENLPARYETWLEEGDRDDELARAIGRELYTIYVPLLDPDKMQELHLKVKTMADESGSPQEAASAGICMIREEILT